MRSACRCRIPDTLGLRVKILRLTELSHGVFVLPEELRIPADKTRLWVWNLSRSKSSEELRCLSCLGLESRSWLS